VANQENEDVAAVKQGLERNDTAEIGVADADQAGLDFRDHGFDIAARAPARSPSCK
jgi:hypothetical protein